MNSASGQAGFSLLEIAAAVAFLGVISLIGAKALSHFGSRAATNQEASRLVDDIWELRSQATTGMKSPCLDFPDSVSVRLYNDLSPSPDGFGAGDRLVRTATFTAGIKTLSLTGGKGPTHFVCFESRGVLGSASAALQVTLGRRLGESRRVRLLPSTGIAKVLGK